MQTAEIEAAILEVVGARYMKVAMVIAKVVDAIMATYQPGMKHGNWFPTILKFL